MSTSHTLGNIDIVKGLAEQWKQGELCDVKLVVDGDVIPAHKNVLSAASPYFRSMILGEFKESKSDEISLEGMTQTALLNILNAIYTKELKLTNEIVGEVLAGADFLQINDISDKCEQHMISNLSSETCFDFLKLCETFDKELGRKACNGYIIKHFSTVRKNREFLEINKDALCFYLDHELLKIEDEIEAFKAAKLWIEHDKKREQFAAEIMHTVRFASIPSEILTQDIAKIPFIRQNDECMELLFQTFNYQSNVYNQPMYNGPINRPRGKPSIFVLEAGKQIEDLPDLLFAVDNHDTDMWHVNMDTFWMQPILKKIPTAFAYASVSVVTYGNFLFLFGVENTHFSPVSMRFDATNNKWIDLKPIPDQSRVFSSIARLEDVIVIAGGMYVEKDTPDTLGYETLTKSVYLYNIAANSWTRGKDLPEPIAKAGACEFKGEMYVAGGEVDHYPRPGRRSIDKVWAYNLKADIWTVKPSLPADTWNLCLAPFNNSIYAFGGDGFDGAAILAENGTEWQYNDDDDSDQLCDWTQRVHYLIHDETIFILDHLDYPQQTSLLYVCDRDGHITRCDKQLSRHDVEIQACALLTLK